MEETNNNPHNIKSSDDKRLSWKPITLVWHSHWSRIDAKFGQSVLAVFYSTTRLNTLKCNSRFWVNLWPSWQVAGRRFGLDVDAAVCCCKGMSLVHMCACGNKADLSFSSQVQPFALLLHCLQLAMVLGFLASACSPPRPLSRDLEMYLEWLSHQWGGVLQSVLLSLQLLFLYPSRVFSDMFGTNACEWLC